MIDRRLPGGVPVLSERPWNEYVWLVIGTLIITVGAGTAGIFAFEGRVALVAFGFALFFVGYRASQFGVYRWPERTVGDAVQATVAGFATAKGAVQFVALLFGAVGIAYGVTLFSQTIIEPAVRSAVIAGLTSIGGYMCAHFGMNGRLL
ncbi:hypothetical protein RH858_15375 [Halalkaliarchaeum sp. AArc-GB]|uniref:hypothetical protein n=1 Tax=Halalkaliarchaeum sp. AArc-GB TaxID=3074078 RepID=UPI0028611DEF|nr:hypothetical protein [Halalkaliarchaeum sp. AArc-GB]MDR5674507.1 hypothetical protein [Halalkaliarchaeum sp. AArc-GB]